MGIWNSIIGLMSLSPTSLSPTMRKQLEFRPKHIFHIHTNKSTPTNQPFSIENSNSTPIMCFETWFMFRDFRYTPRNRSTSPTMSTKGKLVVWVLVVWDSRDTPKNPNPFHFWLSQESKPPTNHWWTWWYCWWFRNHAPPGMYKALQITG